MQKSRYLRALSCPTAYPFVGLYPVLGRLLGVIKSSLSVHIAITPNETQF